MPNGGCPKADDEDDDYSQRERKQIITVDRCVGSFFETPFYN